MAKKTPKQVKPKTGLARCMELASNKKGLIFISAILSSLASIASFIPYIAVYFIIRSILQVYPNLNSLDVNEVIGYGWLALGGIIANILLYFLAIFCSHLAAFGTLYELNEYSCAMKSHFRKFGNQSSGTRKSPILCLMTYPFLFGYWSRPCRICGA